MSIDYGMGKTNVDQKTGIRFGVIPAQDIGQFWYDDSEPVYPSEHYCSYCGEQISVRMYNILSNGEDRKCKKCHNNIGIDDINEQEEPVAFIYKDKEYFMHQSTDDCDIWIEKSPYYTLCDLCSPCAPGAGYIREQNDNGYKAYCFGPEWYDERNTGDKPVIYRVSDGTRVVSKSLTIETYLPNFPGFYGTIFDMDNETSNEINKINEEQEKSIGYDDITTDFSGYCNAVANSYVQFIEKKLQETGIVTSVEFQKIVSPKEYNFLNDSINVAITVDVERLQKYFNDASDVTLNKFSEYIRNKYTSCSGFISSYSNFSCDWVADIGNIENTDMSHKLGSILEFILQNEECIGELEDYEYVTESVNISEYVYLKE